MSFDRPLRWVLGGALALVAPPCLAGPEDLAIAEKLFDQGKAEMAAGNYASACPRLAESRRLDAQVGVTLYLAECYQQTGKIASAWGLFRDAAQMAAATHDAREPLARKRAEALEKRLATLDVHVPASSEVVGLEILQDDTPVPRARWNVATPVDPGEHLVTARAKGQKTWTHRFVVERDGQIVDVDVPRLDEEPAAETPKPLEQRPATLSRARESERDARPRRLASYALFGVSALALGAGTVFGARAWSNADDVKSLCPAYPQCTAGTSAQALRLNDDARGQGTVSTVAFGVSAAALAAAIVLLVAAVR